jgi:alanyl-tRNA synthetase
MSGTLVVGQQLTMAVDKERRLATAAHHTATHLLHAALRQTLGDHVKQAGSLVGPDRLRFDFTHFSPLTAEQIDQVEDLVNRQIWSNNAVSTAILAKDDAVKEGAMALFGEKYDDRVRVVSLGGFSKELCGGTHVEATGQLGLCKVVAETGIASGVRRIEALAGVAAFAAVREQERRERRLTELLGVGNAA